MPHVERRKFHRNILVQDPVRAHQAKRDCGHCALGTATPPGGKSKRSQQEGPKQAGSHRDFFPPCLPLGRAPCRESACPHGYTPAAPPPPQTHHPPPPPPPPP